ncbi:MAG: Asp-tRNA(Asn)/Glu-tRNA(Gln) amidotransferase subunit GatB [Candidatus Pacebacteria bacterium]|nr:Asp-tRNA(Asn)/Glu-tRNA(Gln) amidotransferase subunit GatB [Candidatus Paceibacterota bacterium]
MMYKSTIGLEIHIELNTKSKMFCSCANDSTKRYPNVNICPICMGHPGTLPSINEEAVRKVIKTGLALKCRIPSFSKFDRKNYFYPDLPKGYQISQYDKPLCEGGCLNIGGKDIRIKRIHLEEDTGKLIHSENKDYSLVDFNRAGIPLMELVTEPDLNTAKQTRKFAEELHIILKYLGVSEADMEKGQMRVEVNISLSKNELLGTKVEIKNLNSFRAVEKAVDYEINRQKEVLESNRKVIQETRGWDDKKEITLSQREKEEAHDYRYFPEPDLPPLNLSADFIAGVKTEIPELPQRRRERFLKEYSLDKESIDIFVSNKDLGEYFEKVISELKNWIKENKELSEDEEKRLIKLASNYTTSDLLGLLKNASIEGEDFKITAENFAEFIALIYEDKISSKIAKAVLEEMFETGRDPSHIIEEKGLVQLTDESEIKRIIREIISNNLKAVEDYRRGKENAVQFLIGQVMAATRGTASPEKVNQILKDILSGK